MYGAVSRLMVSEVCIECQVIIYPFFSQIDFKMKFFAGILDASLYHSILQRQMMPRLQILFPDQNCFFQQDNDPKHTAGINKKYLSNKRIKIMDWPSQSPDLNPIENLWSILNFNLRNRKPNNEAKLFQCLQDEWNALPINLLQKLADSMPRRCQAVIDAKGYSTKY